MVPSLFEPLKFYCIIKAFFSSTSYPMSLKLGMCHGVHVLKYCQYYSSDDLGFIFSFLMTRPNLVSYAFIWENATEKFIKNWSSIKIIQI